MSDLGHATVARHDARPGTTAHGYVVRACGDADVPAVQAIYAYHVLNSTGTFEEVPPTLPEMEERRRGILERGLPFLVGGRHGRIDGFAYASIFRPRSAYRYTVEDSVYVDPDCVGNGLGRLLLDTLIAQCRKLGYRQMIAVIGDSANHRSLRLHEAAGFARAGVLVAAGFKFDRWLDAVFMQRTLSEDADLPPPA